MAAPRPAARRRSACPAQPASTPGLALSPADAATAAQVPAVRVLPPMPPSARSCRQQNDLVGASGTRRQACCLLRHKPVAREKTARCRPPISETEHDGGQKPRCRSSAPWAGSSAVDAPGCEKPASASIQIASSDSTGRLRQLRPEMISRSRNPASATGRRDRAPSRHMAAAQPRPPRRSGLSAHSATSPASGHPVTGRPPVQFGTAVKQEAGQHRPEIAEKQFMRMPCHWIESRQQR